MIFMKISRCQMKDLDSIYILSQALANYFPRPEQYITGIYELLLNAFEHGNLAIGFEKKQELVRDGKWKEEIQHRLSLPEYAGKSVSITLSYNENESCLIITDEGNGFPWKEYLQQPHSTKQLNGRGLMIALDSKFDQVSFNATGNEVTCVVRNHKVSDDEIGKW